MVGSEQNLIIGDFPYMSIFIKDVENTLLNNDISPKKIMRSNLEQGDHSATSE